MWKIVWSDQATFYYYLMVRFWHSHACCKHLKWWAGVSSGVLTGLLLHSPIHSKLTPFYHIFSVICSTFRSSVAFPWDGIRCASLQSPCLSESLGHLRPCCQFTSCPSLGQTVGISPCMPGTPNKTCHSDLAHGSCQSHSDLFAYSFSCVQHINFENWLFTRCLIYPTSLERCHCNNIINYYSHHLWFYYVWLVYIFFFFK